MNSPVETSDSNPIQACQLANLPTCQLANLPTCHLAIRLTGTVQGVGFRPFIYNLAREYQLEGTVRNDNGGVLIQVQSPPERLQAFIHAIRDHHPPIAVLDSIRLTPLPVASYDGFRILPSERLDDTHTTLPPDLAVCSECLSEMNDPVDRRFEYPFINCTHCGPRWTIVQSLPYDRPATTMSPFEMCPDCRHEYETPSDRRFHAQPTACPKCGPRLALLIATPDGWQPQGDHQTAIPQAVQALSEHKILLLQGIGGFHLACDARDEATVAELRRRKQRLEKPFAVMFPDLDAIRRWCEADGEEEALLASIRAPIVLLRKRPECPAAESVAPENPLIGAMLPYSPLHHLLLSKFKAPLVMTSANQSDEPIAYKVKEALLRLHGAADAALIHNREIHVFADDSVARKISGSIRLLRRSRGYVPEPVKVAARFRRDVLAFGPHLKNTLCLGKKDGNQAFLSQHIGDLDSESVIEAYQRARDHLRHLFEARVELAACDLHPDYISTTLAEEWCQENGIPLVHAQHHHAHFAACLAENGESGPAIGICLDGTGYGSDGTIWGGEILTGGPAAFQRAGYLLPVPMPGGELAVKQPWRMALAWLHQVFGRCARTLQTDFTRNVEREIGAQTLEMLLNEYIFENIYPLTSSLGRLFDAVAAMLFFGIRSQFEGQAASQLEWLMPASAEPPYPFDIERANGRLILSPAAMFHALVKDQIAGISAAVISRRFHEGLVAALAEMCRLIRDDNGCKTAALSGGCFQNAFLLTRLEEELTARGFRVLTHHLVPTGDGGVSLGQAVIANAQGD